jgi:hypothetical protein
MVPALGVAPRPVSRRNSHGALRIWQSAPSVSTATFLWWVADRIDAIVQFDGTARMTVPRTIALKEHLGGVAPPYTRRSARLSPTRLKAQELV